MALSATWLRRGCRPLTIPRSARTYILTRAAAPESTAAGQPIQVIVTKEMADDAHLAVGQKVTVAALGDSSLIRTGIITGIFEPNSITDPFWNGLSFTAERGDSAPTVYPILTTNDNLFRHLVTSQASG